LQLQSAIILLTFTFTLIANRDINIITTNLISVKYEITLSYFFSLFHRAFRFTKFYLHQRMHLFLSYIKIT